MGRAGHNSLPLRPAVKTREADRSGKSKKLDL